ncbi:MULTISPECIES: nitrate reductase molybdenum cofactor assembly chaperone [unclassified Bartonella]|uniref:nitrate reductase molybdenum cofactor assembly chaperone n=1 Tax=unclassified Bartonella TaxID=2645622 RepID=UPI0015FC055E|nr:MULTISPECIES: nitrate reductase molybdenum cofactor assembly chaperone [unclassified Bartonella]UXN04515.1 nitrate reductase molybdenum cofactor assembly chaperone [Bartonella sp. HY406]UXN07819.1 nitrate reductase molybdenum cofactor assembly chaperone [Bartonella sp. HY761]
MHTDLKILSILLAYPEEALKHDASLLAATLEETSELDAQTLAKVKHLIATLGERDIFESQEEYVTLFDRTRSLSLHLFEHVHGESRDRGQAMVDLKIMYEEAGLEINASELPDYLPMFLEYLSTRTADEARQSISDILHIVTAIGERLQKRNSPYAAAFTALEALSNGGADKALLDELRNMEEDDPNDLEALDRIWEEEAVTFGANQGENACGPDRLRTRLRAANRDATHSQH